MELSHANVRLRSVLTLALFLVAASLPVFAQISSNRPGRPLDTPDEIPSLRILLVGGKTDTLTPPEVQALAAHINNLAARLTVFTHSDQPPQTTLLDQLTVPHQTFSATLPICTISSPPLQAIVASPSSNPLPPLGKYLTDPAVATTLIIPDPSDIGTGKLTALTIATYPAGPASPPSLTHVTIRPDKTTTAHFSSSELIDPTNLTVDREITFDHLLIRFPTTVSPPVSIDRWGNTSGTYTATFDNPTSTPYELAHRLTSPSPLWHFPPPPPPVIVEPQSTVTINLPYRASLGWDGTVKLPLPSLAWRISVTGQGKRVTLPEKILALEVDRQPGAKTPTLLALKIAAATILGLALVLWIRKKRRPPNPQSHPSP